MPPGLKFQIIVAIAITASAFLLPTALSANGAFEHAAADRAAVETMADVSAGSVSTSTHAFDANGFPASAYTDWER